jgi:peptidoglycan/LPS O-acetylase OafA/YrhL
MLVHTGIALTVTSKYLFHTSASFKIIISIISTMILSYIVYQRFEKYFMKFGKDKKNQAA